jgi:hypothetical protein
MGNIQELEELWLADARLKELQTLTENHHLYAKGKLTESQFRGKTDRTLQLCVFMKSSGLQAIR